MHLPGWGAAAPARGGPRYRRVLALDIRPPAQAHGGKTEFIKIDLTQPTIDGELATLLERHAIDTLVHGAFLSHPTHASDWAHELEDVGTMHVLNACAGVEPRRLVLISTTLVYGAHPKNPNFLTEDAELRGHRAGAGVDRVVDQLLDHRCRPLDHLAGRDLIDHVRG